MIEYDQLRVSVGAPGILPIAERTIIAITAKSTRKANAIKILSVYTDLAK